MTMQRQTPYIWVTWLTKLLAGEAQCDWASWFKAHNKYDKLPSDFNLTQWTADHNQMLLGRAQYYRDEGYTVYIEDQNSFMLEGESGAILSGKADIVAVKGNEAIVEDCKTGQPRNSDHMQVLIYMLVLPLTVEHCNGLQLNGLVKYKNDEVFINNSRVDESLKNMLRELINKISGDGSMKPTPSFNECRFCDISKQDCSVRMDTTPKKSKDHGLF
jgi:CRISPR/Cas system-associated exonuclease Cas4 (RecB family)